jgi:hypothetical protein
LQSTFGSVKVFLRADLINAFNQQGVEFPATGIGHSTPLETEITCSASTLLSTTGAEILDVVPCEADVLPGQTRCREMFER